MRNVQGFKYSLMDISNLDSITNLHNFLECLYISMNIPDEYKKLLQI